MPAPELATILAEAGRLKLSGEALASAAGIRPETLSRLRRAEDCRLSTLRRLASAVGLSVEVLPYRAEASRAGRALRLAARKLSAGRRQAISATDLETAIRDPEAGTRWPGHLAGLLEELPIELLHDLVIEGTTSFEALSRLADRLGLTAAGEKEGTIAWIEEMAGDRVASAT